MRFKHDVFATAEAIKIKHEKSGKRIFWSEGNVLAPLGCRIEKGTAFEIYHPVNSLAGQTLTDLIISNPPGICDTCTIASECPVLAKGAVKGEGMAKEFVHIIEV